MLLRRCGSSERLERPRERDYSIGKHHFPENSHNTSNSVTSYIRGLGSFWKARNNNSTSISSLLCSLSVCSCASAQSSRFGIIELIFGQRLLSVSFSATPSSQTGGKGSFFLSFSLRLLLLLQSLSLCLSTKLAVKLRSDVDLCTDH